MCFIRSVEYRVASISEACRRDGGIVYSIIMRIHISLTITAKANAVVSLIVWAAGAVAFPFTAGVASDSYLACPVTLRTMNPDR